MTSRVEMVLQETVEHDDITFVHLVDLARQLEEELAASQAQVAGLKKEIEQRKQAYAGLEESIFGTGACSGEEFMLRELAVHSLIDEVQALRRGVGFTHVGEDPVKYLLDEWTGVMKRESAVMSLDLIRKTREKRAIAAKEGK